jgi:hypothetical protein
MAKRVREASLSSSTNDAIVEIEDRQRSRTTDQESHPPKYASIEPPDQDEATMRCALNHKPLTFNTYEEYEVHYQQCHTNRCQQCHKNFPSAHFLELHIAESHDPITAARRDAGERTYACFVEGCEKVCGEWKKRRAHLVDKHGFPKNYDFLVVEHGIDGRRSLLRAGVDEQGHRKSSRERGGSISSAPGATPSTDATSVSGSYSESPAEEQRSAAISSSTTQAEDSHGNREAAESTEPKDDDQSAGTKSTVNELTSAMSSLNMVPRSVTFGRRKGRAGLAKS